MTQCPVKYVRNGEIRRIKVMTYECILLVGVDCGSEAVETSLECSSCFTYILNTTNIAQEIK